MAKARRRRAARRTGPWETASAEALSNPVVPDGVDQAIDPAIEAMIEKIKQEPIDDWGVFNTGAPVTAQAKKLDNTYRTVPLAGEEEFMFAGLRVGKRGKMIFEFRPIDPTYALFEFDETKVFEAVKQPDQSVHCFEEYITHAIMGDASDGLDWDKPGDGYAMARSRFCAKFRKAIVEEKKVAEVAKVKEAEERFESNPLFGIF